MGNMMPFLSRPGAREWVERLYANHEPIPEIERPTGIAAAWIDEVADVSPEMFERIRLTLQVSCEQN